MAVRLQVDDGGATCAECSPTDTAEMLTWPGGEADTSLKTRRISFRFAPILASDPSSFNVCTAMPWWIHQEFVRFGRQGDGDTLCIYFLAAAANTHPGFSLFPAGYLTTEIPA
jgi:hypothetical protein